MANYLDKIGLKKVFTLLKTYLGGTYIPLSQKGKLNGVATLNAYGKVPAAQAQFALRGNLVAKDIDSTTLQIGFYRIVRQQLGDEILGGDAATGVLIQYSDVYREQVMMVGRNAGAEAGEQIETYMRRYLPAESRWTEWSKDTNKDGMVDSVKIENGNLVISFNTDSGKEDISLALTDIFKPNNYYTKQQTDDGFQPKGNYLTEHQDISGKQDKLIAGTGVSIADDGKTISATGSELMTPITWAELKTLRDGKKLVAGIQYRITDFVTTTAQSDTRSAGHQFDIIVTADDEQTLNENARAIQHEGDTYFANSNLAAWELKYTLDNDTTKYAWADAQNGKGVIYWMKDEWENECPYDFKNVQFRRWAVTDVTSTKLIAEAFDLLKQTYVYNAETQPKRFAYKSGNIEIDGIMLVVDANNSDYYYTFSNDGADASINSDNVSRNVMGSCIVSNKLLSLPNNVFFGDYCRDNVFGYECSNNVFGNYCRDNFFGNYCSNNVFGNYCRDNVFGNYCRDNVFGYMCYDNVFGNYCRDNVFWNYCRDNVFGCECSNNVFGDYCRDNVFGCECSNIALQKDFVRYMKIGSGVKYVDITAEQTTSSSQYLQNIEVRGVMGTNGIHKVINHQTVGDAFVTTYQPDGSQTISV